MKNKEIDSLKKIAVPSVFFVIIGVLAIFLIEINITIAMIIECLNLILYLFFLYLKLRNYKLKYYFLGKKFKSEFNKYIRYYKQSETDYRFNLKWAKRAYRSKGTIFSYEIKTPYSDMCDFYDMWLSYDKENSDIFIFCVIYENINNGAGLYGVFEFLSNFSQFSTFEAYSNYIKNSNLFSSRIKNYLIDSSFENAYSAIYREETIENYTRTDEDNIILSMFEEKDKSIIKIYIEEINSTFENFAIEYYINKYKLYGLPENCKKIYFSKNNRERILIVFDKKRNIYKVFKELFEFENEVLSNENEFHSRGFWIPCNKNYGIYANEELAVKDLQIELKNFIEYFIN